MTHPIAQDFMRLSQRKHQGPSDQDKGVPQPPIELPYDDSHHLIDLPNPADLEVPDVNLRALIERRVTMRLYADQALTLAELSYLLWCTQGVKPIKMPDRTLRTVPSAGARHAFETLLLVNNIDGLEPGIYRYIATRHKLIRLDFSPAVGQHIMDASDGQGQILHAAVTFIWVAVAERMTWRYGLRGYRYMHLDAGHVCQNLYLAAGAIRCGVCAIAAFDDDALNSVLDLDGDSQFVIYMASLGKQK